MLYAHLLPMVIYASNNSKRNRTIFVGRQHKRRAEMVVIKMHNNFNYVIDFYTAPVSPRTLQELCPPHDSFGMHSVLLFIYLA